MNQTVVVIAVIVVIVLSMVGVVGYSYAQIHVQLSDIDLYSIDWTSFSWTTLSTLGLNTVTGNWLDVAFDLIEGINLNLTFELINQGLLPVYMPDLIYDINVNGIDVQKGYSSIQTTINPGETKEIISFQNFEKSTLGYATNYIASDDGIINLRISGTAYFELLGIDIPVPFESSKHISIVDEIKEQLNNKIEKQTEYSGGPIRQNIDNSPIDDGTQVLSEEILDSNIVDLNLSLSGKTMFDSEYHVKPNSYTSVSFTLPCIAKIQGGFLSNAGLENDVIVSILDEFSYNQHVKGEFTYSYYASKQIDYDTFDVTLEPGKYYIVMSNIDSSSVTKTVQLQVAGLCN